VAIHSGTRRALLSVVCALSAAFSNHVAADGGAAHAYCARTVARADSDAALLWAPKLGIQGLRYPSGIDVGPATAGGFQLRVGLAYSLIDPLRAWRTQAAAELDCEVEQARSELAAALDAEEGSAEGSALRAQAEFLRAHQVQIDEVVQRARTRLGQRVITVFELNHILESAEQLERKAVQAQGAAARLAAAVATAAPARAHDMQSLSAKLTQRSSAHEQSVSSVRVLDAWNVRVQGGVIPVEGSQLDWFGWLELSYSLGGPFQTAAESRYREARRAELASDVHGLPAQLARRDRIAHAQTEQATAELRVVEKRLGHLRETMQELTASDPSGSSHARDALVLAQLSADAERVFLQRLLDSLAQGS
jgi:hypothetical protein